MTGHGDVTPLGDTTNSYSPAGDLLSSRQQVASTRAYVFDGDPADEGGALLRTQLDEELVASTSCDAWGNAVASCAGSDTVSATNADCLRYGSVDYDPEFNQLALSEHLAVDRSGGTVTTLDYQGIWDRGLGAILTSTDPNGLSTSVTCDGLGRLTSA